MSASPCRAEFPAAAEPAARMPRIRSQRRKAAIAFLAFMSGGSLIGMGGCATLLKEAAMGTTRQYVLGLLDPIAIASSILGEDLAESEE